MKLTIEYLLSKGFERGSEDGMVEYAKSLTNGYYLGLWYHSGFDKFEWDIEDGYNTQDLWLSTVEQVEKLIDFLELT